MALPVAAAAAATIAAAPIIAAAVVPPPSVAAAMIVAAAPVAATVVKQEGKHVGGAGEAASRSAAMSNAERSRLWRQRKKAETQTQAASMSDEEFISRMLRATQDPRIVAAFNLSNIQTLK